MYLEQFACTNCGVSDEAYIHLDSVLHERIFEGCISKVKIDHENNSINLDKENLTENASHVPFINFDQLHTYVQECLNNKTIDEFICIKCKEEYVSPDGIVLCIDCDIEEIPYPDKICEGCAAYREHQQ